ncbi:MAG: TlpA family protein disulfide reductase [Proteobacteria bacterium]|nr:TlpA family protein disulfide reductase [Pseudomonadota bacterium]
MNMKIIQTLISLLFCLGILGEVSAAQLSREFNPPFPAEEFSLIDLDEKIHKLSDYKGKPLIVNFWATWCPPCRAEMPSMERAWQKIESEGIAMIGINVGEDFEQVFSFTADIDVSFPLLLDLDGQVTGSWPIQGLPTTYILDPDGKMVYRMIGSREWDDEDLLDAVRDLRQ